jgi:hypothetical protein
MKIIALAILLFAANSILAQGSWMISMNKKILISSSVSNEDLNKKAIKSSKWKKGGYLEVHYTEKAKPTWKHMIQLQDEKGNEILKKEDTSYAKLQLATLRKLFAGKKEIKIYMIISPPNAMMMAPLSIVHLGTLKLP